MFGQWLSNLWIGNFTITHYFFLLLSLLFSFLSPTILRFLLFSTLSSRASVHKVHPRGEILYWLFFSAQVLLVFLGTILSFVYAVQVLARNISPDIKIFDALDQPLTARLFLSWLSVIFLPALVFKDVGLVGLRDTHQILKEMTDKLERFNKRKD